MRQVSTEDVQWAQRRAVEAEAHRDADEEHAEAAAEQTEAARARAVADVRREAAYARVQEEMEAPEARARKERDSQWHGEQQRAAEEGNENAEALRRLAGEAQRRRAARTSPGGWA